MMKHYPYARRRRRQRYPPDHRQYGSPTPPLACSKGSIRDLTYTFSPSLYRPTAHAIFLAAMHARYLSEKVEHGQWEHATLPVQDISLDADAGILERLFETPFKTCG